MNATKSLLVQSENGLMRLVRGCPCYMEFGREKVCINSDTISPIRSIEVDPSLIINSYTLRDILDGNGEDRETCYLLIHLEDSDDTAYCVSQSRIITINKTPVKTTDIEEGLEFVARTEPTDDGVLCSTCLYKYLKTTSSNFGSIISDEEKTEALCGYVKRFATMMASGATNINSFPDNPSASTVEERIKELRIEKQVISARALGADNGGQVLAVLNSIVRLESVFYYHVLDVWETRDPADMVEGLHVLNSITKSLMSTADEACRKISESISDENLDVGDAFYLLSQKRDEAERNTRQLRGLSSMLSRAGFSDTGKSPNTLDVKRP